MNQEVIEKILKGEEQIAKRADPHDEVIKHKTEKKRKELELKLRNVLASDLINVRQYEERVKYLKDNLKLLSDGFDEIARQ